MALYQPLDPARPEARQLWTFHLHDPVNSLSCLSWLDLALYHSQLKGSCLGGPWVPLLVILDLNSGL